MKKFTLTVVILLLLLFSGLRLHFVNLVRANVFPDPGPDLPRIYIRNDGSVEPATAPIERTDNLYKLTDNIILYTIEIQRDNIVLDGAGYTIQGNASRIKGYDDGNNGVIVAGQNNVTITRLNFEQGDTGVRISGCSNINITANTFINGLTTGIAAEDYSSFILIESNNFTGIGNLDYFGSQAILCNGRDNIIKRNTLTDGGRGITLEGYSNLISDNKIEVMYPIKMDRADSNIIARNEISGRAGGSDPDQFTGNEGIWLFAECSNNIISGNNITGFRKAIRITSRLNNTVYGNYFANNQFAIDIDSTAEKTTFYGNTFTADSCKIRITNVEDTLWDNGTIGNYWGDYNGTDADGDGIGDTPYIVIGYKWDSDVDGDISFVSGQDNYPLMEPNSIPEFPSWIILPLVLLVTVIAMVYRKKLRKN